MNWASLAGVLIAIGGIVCGQWLEGGQLRSLLQPAAFVVVLLGTVGAVLLQTEFKVFMQGLRMLRWVWLPPADDHQQLAHRIQQWSQLARKEGTFALEPMLRRERDPYILKGLQLVIDGTAPDHVQDICSSDSDYYAQQAKQAANIWSAAGGYAPTVGILGAVLGLIHVMENLTDPAKIGSGIAVAFVATVYGVGLANLLFLPIANKLRSQIQQQLARRDLLLEVWVAIARGDHPKLVAERVSSYVKAQTSV